MDILLKMAVGFGVLIVVTALACMLAYATKSAVDGINGYLSRHNSISDVIVMVSFAAIICLTAYIAGDALLSLK